MTLQPLVHLHQKDATARGSGLRYLCLCVCLGQWPWHFVPNTQQTELPTSGLPEFAGHAVKSPAVRVADNMLDLTTAVFLLRKSVEEMNNTHIEMLEALKWYLAFTYEEFNR